ncbi:MAG TPA: MFS transporter [Candidatus Limnocylindrales bacterium]|jgi:MFS family permease
MAVHLDRTTVTRRARRWLDAWGPMLPMFIAEATIWVGFGALLPILPIYFTAHGVDLPTLGIVVAAWPAARLLGEPLFGWVADRGPRKAMMVLGLLLASVFAVAPLFVVGPAAFIVWRALAGLSASIYDPAARGYLVDANPPERHGELFGLYGAAQMGGLMVGPAIGGIAAALTGQPTIVFWIAGAMAVASAIVVALRVPDLAHQHRPADDAAAVPGPLADEADDDRKGVPPKPRRLVNRLLIAAVAFNMGSFFASGAYEVVWSLYLTHLGASLGLIGLTFFTFAAPILVLSPWFGRFIDREGGFYALVVGMAGVGICGLLYPAIPEIWFMAALGIVEGTAFALASPALFLLVARASPDGRSSTAQGIFGAAGTLGTIIASLTAGLLAAENLTYPFYATGIAALVSLAIGLAIGRHRLWDAMQPRHPAAAPGSTATAVQGEAG